MKDQTLIIEYADIAIEELITHHKSDDKRYKKLNYEPLKHDLSGHSSVRIGFTSKYRHI